MKKPLAIIRGMICLMCLCLISLSCGKKEKEVVPPTQDAAKAVTELPFYADTLLPGSIETYDIELVDSINTILSDDADSSLGQKARRYLSYNFVGLATARYEVRGVPVSVQIAQFASLEDAYGFYASLRPDGIGRGGLGTESFSLDATTHFTKGEFVVTLSVGEEDDTLFVAQSLLGQEISSRISGAATAPQFFMLFPFADKIAFSNKYYSRDFLDVGGLDKVYTTSYLTGGDTAVLFLIMDESGMKFLKLQEYAESTGKVSPASTTFAFDDGYSVSFKHPTQGMIVAGLVRSKLVGIIGYDPDKNDRLATTWVQGLK